MTNVLFIFEPELPGIQIKIGIYYEVLKMHHFI